jgi:hypothetical protein
MLANRTRCRRERLGLVQTEARLWHWKSRHLSCGLASILPFINSKLLLINGFQFPYSISCISLGWLQTVESVFPQMGAGPFKSILR